MVAFQIGVQSPSRLGADTGYRISVYPPGEFSGFFVLDFAKNGRAVRYLKNQYQTKNCDAGLKLGLSEAGIAGCAGLQMLGLSEAGLAGCVGLQILGLYEAGDRWLFPAPPQR
jgi:hypothetical protein